MFQHDRRFTQRRADLALFGSILNRPIRVVWEQLFTKEQRAFYAAHAPEGLALDDLVPLGPINILKLAYIPEGFARRLVAELWFYPDGSRILELSDKTRPAAAFQLAAETKAFLADRGVDLSGEQQTKTRTALEYFSKVAQAQA